MQLATEVRLASHDDRALAVPRAVIPRSAAIVDDHDDIRARDSRLAELDAARLDRIAIASCARARRVDDRHRDAAPDVADLEVVARRARLRRDERALLADERVEQRRLPGIHRPDERDR